MNPLHLYTDNLQFQTSFDTFSHTKPVLIRDLGWLGEKVGSVRYPPYTANKLTMLQLLLKNWNLPRLPMTAVGYVGSFAMGVAASTAGVLGAIGAAVRGAGL